MNPELYQQYLTLKLHRKKPDAEAKLTEFIQSFQSADEMSIWVRAYLAERTDDQKISYQIFTDLVFPVLLAGYEQRDAWSTLWLAKLSLNLHHKNVERTALENKSSYQLKKEAYALDPTDGVRRTLLDHILNWFEYSQHEWPTGILYGIDGAERDECDEILQEVAEARRLDVNCEHTVFLDSFESKVLEYRTRLTSV